MSKILRKSAKIFGSTPGPNQIAQFGSLAAGSPVFSTDPAVIQNLSNYLEGWFAAVLGGNSPAIEDMNGLCFVMSYQIAYLLQQGVPEYDAGTTYYTNSLVNVNGQLFVSLQDNNLNNPITNHAFWTLAGYKQRTVTAATDTIAAADQYLRYDPTAASQTVTLPDATTLALGKTYTIKAIGTSGNSVTINTTGGQLIDQVSSLVLATQPTNDTIRIQNNGTGWDII